MWNLLLLSRAFYDFITSFSGRDGWSSFSLAKHLMSDGSADDDTTGCWLFSGVGLCKCQFWKEQCTAAGCPKQGSKLQSVSPWNGKILRTYSLTSQCSAVILCSQLLGASASSKINCLTDIYSSFCLLFMLTKAWITFAHSPGYSDVIVGFLFLQSRKINCLLMMQNFTLSGASRSTMAARQREWIFMQDE